MFSFLSVALDSGIYVDYPEMPQEKSATTLISTSGTFEGWTGPDVNGYYSFYTEYGNMEDTNNPGK